VPGGGELKMLLSQKKGEKEKAGKPGQGKKHKNLSVSREDRAQGEKKLITE